MKELKRLLMKWGFPILILLVLAAGVVCQEQRHKAEKKMEEDMWESPSENGEDEAEAVTVTETETAAGSCLLTEEEQKQLQSTVLSAAESVKEIYKDVIIADDEKYSSGVSGLTSEQQKAVVEQLGAEGMVSVGENVNMQNPEQIEAFYEDYLNGKDSTVTVFEVQQEGVIGAVTFIYREERLQTYYTGIRWREDGMPEIQITMISDVAEIKLTEKGYFIYRYEEIMEHAGLREYWRIKPLSQECRELTEKYISGLSYVNYNMLVKNWDSSNVEDILMPCMFEDIYRIDTGENLKAEEGKIPAEEFERIMTAYFPVSAEQLRENCGYDRDSDSYEYARIYASPYPPFGEVVGYAENEDGTLALTVDAVWPDYNSDFAFQNTVVVQPLEDGTFRYLSNSVREKELDLPPIAETEN